MWDRECDFLAIGGCLQGGWLKYCGLMMLGALG